MLRALLAAVVLATASLTPALVRPVLAAESGDASLSAAELMRAAALDEVFTQFGPVIEASPAEQGLIFPPALRAAWTGAAREVLAAERLHARLEAALDGQFSSAENAALSRFFLSDFGRLVSGHERALATLDPERQMLAREHGLELLEGIAPGSRRDRQIDEMLDLVSAEIAVAMVGQSVRGLLIGLSVAQGDIEVPWEEIDAQLALILPQIEADVAETQRAMLAFTYRTLDEAELETYLAFLRTAPARKFYALAAVSIGQIVTDAMWAFGDNIAQRLGRVGV